MKLLITGNLGYVGTELTKYLKNKNKNKKIKIIGFDNGIFEHCIFSKISPKPNVDIQIYSDLRNISAEHLNGIDAVVHLAAISNDPMGNKFKKITKDINFYATKKIINLAIKHKVKKFIFASSCSMYGNSLRNNEIAKNEKSKLRPLTAYAKSKVLIEKYIYKKRNNHTAFTCLRFSTACGVSDRLRLDLVVNDFVASAISRKKIELLSDGSSWRPLIDVKDMCKAIEWSILKKVSKNNEPLFLNVGTDKNNILIKDLAKLVQNIFKNKIKVKFNKNKIFDDRSYKVDFSLYKKLVPKKFHPSVGIDQSVKQIKDFLNFNKFKIKNFRQSKFSRLYYLNYLIEKNKLSKKIIWK